MMPLIKWPGGKTSELKIIEQYLPENYRTYVEPFFGGGALFFEMCPKSAIINDISENLMDFYIRVKTGDTEFFTCLEMLAAGFAKIKEEANAKAEGFAALYRDGAGILEAFSQVAASSVVEGSKLPCSDILKNELAASLADKLKRISGIEKAGGSLAADDLKNNLITGFTAGYYMYVRALFNGAVSGRMPYLSAGFRAASFFFVREFCYGSMFRYNKNGEFNIPYGGISYNNKDFDKKVRALKTEGRQALEGASIYARDFEDIMNMAEEDDFIFLDPPYDSDFSDYEQVPFGKAEHERLARCVLTSPAQCLLIIKNTPLIGELYENKGLNIFAFDNKYSCCVRGRNDRGAEHLIITNYAR